MAPKSSPPSLSLGLKGGLMKSACGSFRYNRRNMENPWYGLWTLELLKLTQSFNNIVIVPQYALWYTLPEEESEIESVEDVDEDNVSDKDGDDDHKSDSSDDEINLLKDPDESTEAIRVDNPEILNIE